MTAFRDQFERRDPFTFNALGLSGRHRNTLFSARKLLEGRSAADLTKIGFAIDDLVTQQAVRVAEWAGEQIAESRLVQSIASMFRSTEYQRDTYGDLQLLQMAGGPPAVETAAQLSPPLRRWEPWAVIAVWKMYDYIDGLITSGEHAAPAGSRDAAFAWSIDGDPALSLLNPGVRSRDRLAGIAAEAASAATRAEWEHEVHGLLRQVHTVASKRADDAVRAYMKRQQDTEGPRIAEAVKAELSKQGTAAVNARHDKPGGSREKKATIRRIWATGKYDNRDRCAEEECGALGMSFSAARRALRNTPDHS